MNWTKKSESTWIGSDLNGCEATIYEIPINNFSLYFTDHNNRKWFRQVSSLERAKFVADETSKVIDHFIEYFKLKDQDEI